MGIKSILSFSPVYNLFQRLTGAERLRRKIAAEYIRAEPGMRILDIGCGTAEILRFLPTVEYYGFDCSEEYIANARKRFGGRGKFECRRVGEGDLPAEGYFDLVLAIGILHHLDDVEAEKLFQLAAKALKPGGRLLTFDGVYVPGQNRIARWIISHDRGKFVRSPDGYSGIMGRVFADNMIHLRTDLLHIPYHHAILECKKSVS